MITRARWPPGWECVFPCTALRGGKGVSVGTFGSDYFDLC